MNFIAAAKNPKHSPPPIESSLEALYQEAYYADSYALSVPAHRYANALQVYVEMRRRMPRWINLMLAVRDFICRAFGMTPTHGFAMDTINSAEIIPGNELDFFRVGSTTKNELVLHLNDRHFQVSIAIFLEDEKEVQQIWVISAVAPKSCLGRGYIHLVKPFHRQVVCSMLRRLIGVD